MSELQWRVDASTEYIELSHELTRGMPNHVSHPSYDLVPYYRHGDFSLEGGYGGGNELLLMSGHSGTHLDALGHVTANGTGFGGVGAAELSAGIDGLREHGIETVGPIVRRGVLVDVVRHRGAVVAAGEAVTADEIRAVLGAAGTEVAAGDCVLVRTGWGRHWDDPEAFMGAATGTPGIDLGAAEYLCDRGAFLIGGDTATVEQQPPGSHALPVHMLVLADRGVHLLENMALEALGERRVVEFVFLCLPLRLKGATGSPVRPVAGIL